MEEIKQRIIEQELKESYLDYSMSVIIGRALPSIRDGLKPVHRRILFSMWKDGLKSDKPFKKSATTVGAVIGSLHPHGDQAVYDSLVRMAQDFSLRYPLIHGHGNFGSIDGFEAGAYRYTEAKLSKLAEELLEDIDKETVDFVDNFDGSMKEPLVLPGKLPNLLINGSSGIAVGMATNIPPHNLREVCDAVVSLVENPELDINDVINIIKGPDFPTGGLVCGTRGIIDYFKTGRGKIVIRAKTEIENGSIIITEIPYQINKTALIESIAELVKNKGVDGITNIRDESDSEGMRIVLELKKDINSEIVLNQLYKSTSLENAFGVIMLGLIDNQPKVLNLKELILEFIKHRKEVIVRRTKYELNKAEERAHILDGLKTALSNIDPVIALIKKSKDADEAKKGLTKNFNLSEKQALAILEMRLQRLTSLEQNKIIEEYNNLLQMIKEYKEILASDERINMLVKDDMIYLKDNYGDDRRTQIIEGEDIDIETEDLIKDEDVVITVTYSGYIKQIPLDVYKQQRRGGKGVIGTDMKEEDAIEHLFTTNNKSYLLFFTNKGKVHWLRAFETPQAGRYAKGKAIVNLLHLESNEKVSAVLSIPGFSEDHSLLFITKRGAIKRTGLEEFSNPRKGGIKSIGLIENDEVVQVRLIPKEIPLELIIATRNGGALRFNQNDVRGMGRSAKGVRGIRLRQGDEVIGMEIVLRNGSLLTVTENGYGKRTNFEEYRLTRRGGKGILNIKVTPKNGKVAGIKTVKDGDEIMLMSEKGIVIRIPAKDISVIGRNTQGVRLMKLNSGDKVVTIARVIANYKILPAS